VTDRCFLDVDKALGLVYIGYMHSFLMSEGIKRFVPNGSLDIYSSFFTYIAP